MLTLPNPYIQYISTLMQSSKTPSKISDLSDCIVLNELLSKITEFKLPNLQNNPKSFAHIFSNLKQTYKQIQLFWQEYLGRPLQCGEIDLVEIAHHSNQAQIQKIIDLFIQTAVQSSEKQYFVNKILETSNQTQQYFMNIVQKTIQQQQVLSPRKKREQRLYDKLIQLDHENQNLQQVIKQICEQKFELQVKYQHLIDGIKQKNIEIQRLSGQFKDYYQTPQRKKNLYNQSIDKNSEYIQRLKSKITQLSRQHQKQVYQYEQQIQIFTNKMQKLIDLQNKVELYEAKIQANDELLSNYDALVKKYTNLKDQVSQKQTIIGNFAEKLSQNDQKLRRLQDQVLEKDTQIQKLSHKIQQYRELTTKLHQEQSNGCLSPISLRKTLSEQCPDVYNTQTELLMQTNKKLRQQLQRSSYTIRQRQNQLIKLKKQFQIRQNLQFQNRKLLSVIQQNNEKHEDQKYLLLGCVYELRNRYVNEVKPKQVRKQQIKKLQENPYKRVHCRSSKQGLSFLENFTYE